MKQKTIKMSSKAYEAVLVKIERLSNELMGLSIRRKDVFSTEKRENDIRTPEMNAIDRMYREKLAEIQRLNEMLFFVEIDNSILEEDVVNISDVVRLRFDEEDEEVVRLVCDNTNGYDNNGVMEVSVNSPIGTAIFKRKPGEKVAYKVGKNTFLVEIVEKVREDIKKRVK